MNLNGAADEVELPIGDDEIYVQNSWTDSIPVVIHGNGPAKVNQKKKQTEYFSTWKVFILFLIENLELYQ